MSGDDGLSFVNKGNKDGGDKVGKTFSHAGGSIDDEMLFALERFEKSERHRPLLRAELKWRARGKLSLFTEDAFNLHCKVLHGEIIAK